MPGKFSRREKAKCAASRLGSCAVAAFALVAGVIVGVTCVTAQASGADFVTAVTSTHPVAYYRLDSTQGKSQVGATKYTPSGGVTGDTIGAPTGIANTHFVKFDGHDGYILTTQAGGVGEAASMMAWVNLSALPSAEGRIFYIVGESQSGNDLDIQFENDNALKFYTAAGGHVTYAPAPATLLNRWHMIVATVDTVSQTRVIYWDGKAVATDKGGGRSGKTGIFSIGDSTVFRGRFFKGGIAEVALWNRALTAAEVTTIYATAKPVASAPAPAAVSGTAPGTGPFASGALVTVEDANGPVALKREEQIAIMFLTAMEAIEHDCQFRAKRACTMDELLNGPPPAGGTRIDHLKFDPLTDPNYTYTLTANGTAWEAHANAKKPGLLGFYYFGKRFPTTDTTYNPGGMASATDKDLTSRSIEGDSFTAP